MFEGRYKQSLADCVSRSTLGNKHTEKEALTMPLPLDLLHAMLQKADLCLNTELLACGKEIGLFRVMLPLPSVSAARTRQSGWSMKKENSI